MGMIGHYRRITPNRLTELQNNPDIVTFLFSGDEAAESDGRYLNIDKT